MKKRAWALFTALVVGSGTAQEVEFPPDYYSFEEIARRLSIGEHKVSCDPALRERVALVALKSRPWHQVRELLERGLDIRLRKISQSQNHWKLERNPEIARQERRLLEHYFERLQQKLDAELNRVVAPFKTLRDNSSLQQIALRGIEHLHQSLRQQLFIPLEQAQRLTQMPFETFVLDLPALIRFDQTVDSIRLRLLESHPGLDGEARERQLMAELSREHPLQSFGFSAATLRWAEAQASQPHEEQRSSPNDEAELLYRQYRALMEAYSITFKLLDNAIEGYLVSRIGERLSAKEALLNGLAYTERSVTLSPDIVWLISDDKLKPMCEGMQLPLQWTLIACLRREGDLSLSYRIYLTPQDCASIKDAPAWYVLYERLSEIEAMDDTLEKAFREAQERIKTVLHQPVCQRPIKSSRELNFIYEWLLLWCKQHQQEVIAELFPLSRAAGFIEADLRRHFESSLQQLFQIWTANYRAREQTDGRTSASMLPITLDQHNGVWLVRDWTAFLHRAIDYPLASIKQFARSQWEYKDWLHFLRSRRAADIKQFACDELTITFLGRMFADVERLDFDFATAWMVVQLLEGLPTHELAQLLAPTENERGRDKSTVRLNRVHPAALAQFAQSLRMFALLMYAPNQAVVISRCAELETLLREGGFISTWGIQRGFAGWLVGVGDLEARDYIILVYGFASLRGVEKKE